MKKIVLLLVVFVFIVISSYAQEDIRMISEDKTMLVVYYFFDTVSVAQDFADRYAFTYIEENKTSLVGDTFNRVFRNISDRMGRVNFITTHRSDRNIREGDFMVQIVIDTILGYTRIVLLPYNPNNLPSLDQATRVIGIYLD